MTNNTIRISLATLARPFPLYGRLTETLSPTAAFNQPLMMRWHLDMRVLIIDTTDMPQRVIQESNILWFQPETAYLTGLVTPKLGKK